TDRGVVGAGRSVSAALKPQSSSSARLVNNEQGLLISDQPVMHDSTDGPTLFVPKSRGTSLVDRPTLGLPPDLVNRAATRLQILASLYAFTFFPPAFFPRLIFPDERRILFQHAVNWVPGAVSIAVAVSVALVIRMARLRPAATTALGLLFEVVGSYGIAAAEFLQPAGLDAGRPWVGLSWV